MRVKLIATSNNAAARVLALALTAALAACSGSATPPSSQTASTDAARAAELEVRAQQLAQREAELAAKEQEQDRARQQAAAAEVEAAAAAKNAAQARRSSPKNAPAVATSTSTPVKAAPKVPQPIEVPAGIPLEVALSTDLSTKTAKPGDSFEARLVADLVIEEQRIAPAGARVIGTITEVVSGSSTIGAIPMLSLQFDRLQLSDGREIAISGEFVQQGKSEKVRDTAKILSGAAAGAVIGHQVKDNDTGTVVGGILGGAAGAMVAKKTGTEVQLVAGSTFTVTVGESFKIARS